MDSMKEPKYTINQMVYDDDGNVIGKVVHRWYNSHLGKWSYTIADERSWYTGEFLIMNG